MQEILLYTHPLLYPFLEYMPRKCMHMDTHILTIYVKPFLSLSRFCYSCVDMFLSLLSLSLNIPISILPATFPYGFSFITLSVAGTRRSDVSTCDVHMQFTVAPTSANSKLNKCDSYFRQLNYLKICSRDFISVTIRKNNHFAVIRFWLWFLISTVPMVSGML